MKLFISYAHADEYLVRTQIVEILRDANHDPWFDHRLIVGQDWQEQLFNAIQACDAFVYALTPESIASEYCRWEFEQAVEMGKQIVPVLLQKSDLPDDIKRLQWVDFIKGATGNAVARLLGGLQYIQLDQIERQIQTPLDMPAQADSLDIEAVEAQIDSIQQELDDERTRRQNTLEENQALQRQLEALQNRLNQMLDPQTVQSQISALEQRLKDEQTQRKKSSTENLELRQQIEKLQQQFIEFQQTQAQSTTKEVDQLKKSSTENYELRPQLEKPQQKVTEFQHVQTQPKPIAQSARKQVKSTSKQSIPKQQKKTPLPLNAQTQIHRLNAWNPLDWLRLLYWMLVEPSQLAKHYEIYGKGDEEQTGLWLAGTMTCIPLLLWALPINFNNELATTLIQKSNISPPILLIAILGLWLFSGMFGNGKGDLSFVAAVAVGSSVTVAVTSSVASGVIGSVACAIAVSVACAVAYPIAGAVAGAVGLAVVVAMAGSVAGSVTVAVMFLSVFLLVFLLVIRVVYTVADGVTMGVSGAVAGAIGFAVAVAVAATVTGAESVFVTVSIAVVVASVVTIVLIASIDAGIFHKKPSFWNFLITLALLISYFILIANSILLTFSQSPI